MDKQVDEGHEELGTDDIHLRIEMALVDNAIVIKVVVCLQQAHQYGKLATFLTSVLVKFFQEVVVLVFCCRSVHLVLHLKHDGDIFGAVFRVAEDKVAFRAISGIVVLVEIGIRHHGADVLLKLNAAMLFQRLTNHLGGHTRLQIFVVIHLLLFHAQFVFMTFYQCRLMNLCLTFFQLQCRAELAQLCFFLLHALLGLVAFLHNCQLELIVVLRNGGVQLCNGLVFFGKCKGQLALFLALDVLQLHLQTLYFSILFPKKQVFLGKLCLKTLFCPGGCQLLFGCQAFIHLCQTMLNFCFKFCVLYLRYY